VNLFHIGGIAQSVINIDRNWRSPAHRHSRLGQYRIVVTSRQAK
jgi:hypothetical protein